MKSDNSLLVQTAIALLQGGQPIEIKAQGYSMYPLLTPGTTLLVEPTTPSGCRRGDIVVFESNGRLIAHRITALNDHSFVCRGDATLRNDGLMPHEKLLGKVTGRKKQQKTIPLTTLRHRLYGRMVLAFFPLSAYVFIKIARAKALIKAPPGLPMGRR